jgi:hypothetical protein
MMTMVPALRDPRATTTMMDLNRQKRQLKLQKNRLKRQLMLQLKNRLNLEMTTTTTGTTTTTTVAVPRDPRVAVAPRVPRAVTTMTMARVPRGPRAPRAATTMMTMVVHAAVKETMTAIVNAACPLRAQKERVVTPPTRSICYSDNC